MSNKNNGCKVLGLYFDPPTNKTHFHVETPEFTDWYWVRGRVKDRTELLSLVMPLIERQLADFRPADKESGNME